MLGCPPPTLATRWWRQRHGIAAVRVGRRLVFLERDLEAWLEAHREPWGPQPVGERTDQEAAQVAGSTER